MVMVARLASIIAARRGDPQGYLHDLYEPDQ